MTLGERRLLENVARRAEQVRTLAALSLERNQYIPAVMALTAGNLTRTLVLLCGERLRADFFHWLENTLREQNGLCICGEVKANPIDALCAACLAQCEQDDREVEQSLAMEQPVKGPAN